MNANWANKIEEPNVRTAVAFLEYDFSMASIYSCLESTWLCNSSSLSFTAATFELVLDLPSTE